MTPDEKDKYIILLERFKDEVEKDHKKWNYGWSTAELRVIRELQEFEDSLPCNQEEMAR